MDRVDYYKDLYKLQDRVLKKVFETSGEFYLTGGTCLSRFYKALRYSDDLDFFANFSNSFNLEVKSIKYILSKEFKVITEVESKDFVRLMIDDKLQVDFVNDRVKRCGNIIQKNELLIDNIENIFSNKLTAILGRDNPKDIFDIFLIDKYFSPDYTEALKCAKEKVVFNKDELLYRLETFPILWLEKIEFIEEIDLNNFMLTHIIDKIKSD